MPPEIHNEQDRPLIEPEGKSHWTDVKGRTPASVLTVLLKKNHPGMIEYGGKVVVASTWKHYQAATDSAGKSAADVVSEGFWSKKLGREVSDIEAWVHSHRGTNPEDISSLNTEEASSCLEKYKTKAVELNGPDFDWLHSPVDTRALYQSSCGRRHGKWALFNGVIDDNEALPELRSSHANAAVARRQRQEEEERLRKEAHDGRMAKEYAQSMLEWGATVHAYCKNMQKFMEQVASHNGMPATAVPSPPAPPPLPPAYVAASSPNPSLVNVDTFGAPVQMETPEETLSRIAYGGYDCHVNATSGAAPEDDDDFPML